MQGYEEDTQEACQTEVNFQELLRENVTNAGFTTQRAENRSPLNLTNTPSPDDGSRITDNTPGTNIDETGVIVGTNSQHSHNEPNVTNKHENTSSNSSSQPRCISVIGAILRIMGDEQYCRTCGKHLRVMGDEIYCMYAARNLISPLLKELNTEETVYY